MFARLRSLVRALMSRGDFEAGLTEELLCHIEQHVEDLVRSGVSLEEARRRARMEFGGINTVKEECREARGLGTFDALERECRYAARQLRRSPGFAGTVVLTLALAIGANTASFSLLNALLLKNLPYAHPERIGTLYARTSGPEPSDRRRTVDGEQWEHVRDNVPSLVSAVSGMRASGLNVRAGSVAQYVQAGRVSAQYFNVLAIHPLIGRNFSEDEDRPHGPRAAILSYRLWQTALGGQPSALGEAVLLKGEPHTIIGVLPEGATTPLNADVYTALQPSREGEGQSANFVAIMRLRDDATWQQADAELARALSETVRARRFASTNPGAQVTYYAVPLQKAATDTLRPQVLALMLAAGFILLIACANIAGLTLVRMLHRTGEINIRLALGASRWQVQRQLWVEHLLLACLGATAGIGVGSLALRGLLRLVPERVLPVATVPLDRRVLAFTLALSLLTYILSGVLPALFSRPGDLRSSASGRGVIGGDSSLRLRQALIAGEVALTVVLLAATGLLIRTLIGLQTIPPGFNPTGVITAKASLDDVRYHDPAVFRKLLADSLAALRETPGVQSAAVGLTLPYERALLSAVTFSDGKEAGKQITTNEVYVTSDYFETLQIPVLAGRTITDADGVDAQHVVVVNQTFARKFLHQENAVGRYLNTNLLIVGVVADTVLSSAAGLNAGTAPLTREETIYVPAAQVDAKLLSLVHGFFQPSWIVRSASPSGVPAQVQRALASADPQLPVSGFYEMNDLMAATLATQRIGVALLAGISSLALVLSAVGIFALVANIVAQRTREIGIRMALGSTIAETMFQVGRTGVGASVLGLVLGLILCAGALPPMRSVLFGVGVYDGPTMLAVVLTLAAVTLLATTPILRIARIDPARTLREE